MPVRPSAAIWSASAASDYVAHAVQMTNFYSPQPPKTSANWPRSFLHRSKREKRDRKGAYAKFRKDISALANRCFSTESAESVSSLHLRGDPVQDMKAAIHGSGSTPPMFLQAPSTKFSNAQKMSFASSLDCSAIGF